MTKGRLLGLAGLLIGGAAVFFVARTIARDWAEISEELAEANLAWLAVAAAAALAAMTNIGIAWRAVLRVLGVDVPRGRIVAWYYVGELGKYLPGGVWPVLGRGELARRGGIPRSRAYASVALSLGVLYLSAMFVAAAFLPFALSGGGFSPWMLCLLALPVGVGLLHHRVLERMVGLASRLAKRDLGIEIPRWSASLRLLVAYAPTWVFVGLSTYAVARALSDDVDFAQLMFSSILSWVAGFLAIPVPSGAGVREAVMVAASGLPSGLAAAVAVAARLIFVIVDLLGAAVGAVAMRRLRGGGVVHPLPADESV